MRISAQSNFTFPSNCFISSLNVIFRTECNEYAGYAYNKTRSIGIYEPGSITETSNCAALGVELIFGGEKARPREFPHMVGGIYRNLSILLTKC